MTEQLADYDIILFDGNCMLCSRIVRFVIRRDPKRRFRFAALESEAGMNILHKVQAGTGVSQLHLQQKGSRSGGTVENAGPQRERMDGGEKPDTFMLVRGDCIYMKSRAGLEVVRRLRRLWPLLYVFIIVPGPLRDRVYDYIARNRYRWFGRYDHCLLLTPDNKDRFIE